MKKMFLFLAAASLVSATAFAQDDYDYGDDWMFTIHVQKIEDEQRKTNPELIKSVGVLEQYPDYEDWDEDGEF